MVDILLSSSPWSFLACHARAAVRRGRRGTACLASAAQVHPLVHRFPGNSLHLCALHARLQARTHRSGGREAGRGAHLLELLLEGRRRRPLGGGQDAGSRSGGWCGACGPGVVRPARCSSMRALHRATLCMRWQPGGMVVVLLLLLLLPGSGAAALLQPTGVAGLHCQSQRCTSPWGSQSFAGGSAASQQHGRSILQAAAAQAGACHHELCWAVLCCTGGLHAHLSGAGGCGSWQSLWWSSRCCSCRCLCSCASGRAFLVAAGEGGACPAERVDCSQGFSQRALGCVRLACSSADGCAWSSSLPPRAASATYSPEHGGPDSAACHARCLLHRLRPSPAPACRSMRMHGHSNPTCCNQPAGHAPRPVGPLRCWH